MNSRFIAAPNCVRFPSSASTLPGTAATPGRSKNSSPKLQFPHRTQQSQERRDFGVTVDETQPTGGYTKSCNARFVQLCALSATFSIAACKQSKDRVFLHRIRAGFPLWEKTRHTGASLTSRNHRGMSVTSRLAFLAAALAGLALLNPAAGPAAAQDWRAAPEAATGWNAGGLATAKSHMISAANPLAVEAGLDILRDGGSAADAAVAVQLVLNLVEPQSSGIGGGAFIAALGRSRQVAQDLRRARDGARRGKARPLPRRRATRASSTTPSSAA